MDFKINGYNTSRWNLSFEDGTLQELVKAPQKKVSPLNMNWMDQHGEEVDRSYNFYESKRMTIPVFIEGNMEAAILTKYNQFVQEVLVTGADIVLDAIFLNRRFTLRYSNTSNTRWFPEVVTFAIELIDDYPHLYTPIP